MLGQSVRPAPACSSQLRTSLPPLEVAAKFTDYTGVFMLHCHMLDHEDHGLMAQFEVVK